MIVRKYLGLQILPKVTLFALLAGAGFNSAHANFASTATSSPGTCPINHKMYYIGANPPASTVDKPVTFQALNWTAGNSSRTFAFSESSGVKNFIIEFPILLDLNNGFGGTPPFYGSINGATTNGINLVHDSPSAKTNHSLDVSVNRSVSKVGYKIQDLDSTISRRRVPYIEEADVSANQGQLTFNSNFHTRNPAGDVVTARSGENCGTGGCTIDASWTYNLANIALNMKHINTFTQTDSAHAAAYSDFFFCLAPPKLIVKKQLSGPRVANNDQFSIAVTGGSIAANSFTTSGTGSAVNNNSSATLSLKENTSYTITERLSNSTTLADIASYNATYTCNNETTGSIVNVSSGSMTYDANNNTRSFTLANATYGDEITCTITNSPNYVFSGIVFNDNGGITASSNNRQNISSTFINNGSYFNGVFDNATESGIYDSNLQIRLTNCNGSDIATTSSNPQLVSDVQATRGRYSFTVPASALTNMTKVCLIENEPSSWPYTIDTTPNKREVTLINNVYNYKTESNGSRNLDFGEVRADNAALVLIKSQYVHECNNSLNYQSVTNSTDPTEGFSINPISDIKPGNCIAYRIQAYNRGHIGLQQVRISDVLQTSPVTSRFHRPTPLFLPTSVTSPTVAYDTNGTIQSNLFSLAATQSTANQPTSAILYFNTKYGTTEAP
ncbi:hypothetical protein [Psychrobacter sp. M13]|uniref:hypothetical protein n=1 Tax=Psychrobacter sp. M13 TaxID=3067275 RepID=UPI00273B94FD|nr:hypothetical protein [Psychrobacter sp. M13]WLP93581.1 hypothetical protein Q9G97_08215 [Psychrobacter sp. M13]